MRFIITILLLSLLIAPVLAAQQIPVARGDRLDYQLQGAPNAATEYRLWLFTPHDLLVKSSQRASGSDYWISLSNIDIANLPNGKYQIYSQFKGNNGMYDVSYGNMAIRTIYKDVPDVSLLTVSPDAYQLKFEGVISNPIIDDVFIQNEIVIEDPNNKVVNMYTRSNGNLHIDIFTNLAIGDSIAAIIDEEVYKGTEYEPMMSCRTYVTGQMDTTHKFSLEFNASVASQLPSSKSHFITIHYLEDGVTTIPFTRYTEMVPPTPTPEIRYYFAFNGEVMGYSVNTTRPYEPVTTLPTPTPGPVSVLAQTHLDDRTIVQRGDIYVGEKNLDIWGALGWQDVNTENYDFRISYCDGDDSVVTITNPHHFYVDPAIFGDKLGAWCQYSSAISEDHPVVAFFVKNPEYVNLTTVMPEMTEEEIIITPEPTTNMASNITETVATPVPTAPVETPETLVMPLYPWVALAGIGIAVVAMRKK